ncbi:MAG: hypothetical protein ABIO65_12375 [Nitrospiria bacterium]
MIRLLLHPVVLLLLIALGIGVWMWARRVDLRVRLRRLPTRQEWALAAMAMQAIRWLLRLRL